MTTSKTSTLGGRSVGRIGFGAMQLAGPGVFGPPRDRNAALAVLRRAVELGVDHIDTSQYYGPDVVNDLIREALHPYPDGLCLATKVGARRDAEGGWLPAQRPEDLRAGVEENLRSLRVERMDLVNLRLLPAHGQQPVPLAEQLGALEDLRAEGKLDLVGLSNVSRAQAEAALELVDIAGIQNAYSLLDRSSEDLLELCQQRDLAFVPFFPLGSGFVADNPVLGHPAVQREAEKLGRTPAQIVLAWTLSIAPNVLLIPGTSSVSHLEENTAIRDIELDPETKRELDAAA
jgi:pyridoxine 4-dehydrogenase